MSDSRRVLLLRHGRTAWNAERRFQGQADPPLDEVGRMQAYEVAALIACLRPSVLISSDAVRASETASILAGVVGLPVTTDARLRERNLGHWEGKTRDEVRELYPDEYAAWIAGKDVSSRGGETREAVAARAFELFRELPGVETAVLVTHGATSMALAAAVLGLSQSVHILGPLANCHWSELLADTSEPGHHGAEPAWRLKAHNVGVPGVVVPLPVAMGAAADDASDAEA